MEQMVGYNCIPATTTGTLPINTSDLPPGVYLVKFELVNIELNNQILQIPFTLSVVKQ